MPIVVVVPSLVRAGAERTASLLKYCPATALHGRFAR